MNDGLAFSHLVVVYSFPSSSLQMNGKVLRLGRQAGQNHSHLVFKHVYRESHEVTIRGEAGTVLGPASLPRPG